MFNIIFYKLLLLVIVKNIIITKSNDFLSVKIVINENKGLIQISRLKKQIKNNPEQLLY